VKGSSLELLSASDKKLEVIAHPLVFNIYASCFLYDSKDTVSVFELVDETGIHPPDMAFAAPLAEEK
jgi:hypothetical protein